MSRVNLRLHSRIHLTLTDASQGDAEAVMRAVGACQDSGLEDPDVEIQFSRGPSSPRRWRNIGDQDAYACQQRFAVANSHANTPIEVELPDSANTAPFRLSYRSGMRRRFPLLRSMINGKCVDKRLLGVHATAFTFAERGYMVCGWPRGGKTGTLLAYLLQGAEYLAAEWVYVADQGRIMQGVPESIRLRDWHLRCGGKRLAGVALRDRIRLLISRGAAKGSSGLARVVGTFLPGVAKSLRKLSDSFDRHCYVDRPASAWLGKELHPRSASLDILFLVGTHADSDIQVTPLTEDVARHRLIALQDEDMSDLAKTYRRWSYAMAQNANWLCGYKQKRNTLVDQLVSGKRIYCVQHPLEVRLDDLFHALESSVGEPCSQ